MAARSTITQKQPDKAAKPPACTELNPSQKQGEPKISQSQWRASLLMAARSGNERMLREALAHADPSAPLTPGSGANALMHAAANGSAPFVRMLLPVTNPLEVDGHGRSPLAIALLAGHSEAAMALLPYSDPRSCDISGETPLMHAAQTGMLECVKALLPLSDPLAVNAQEKINALRIAIIYNNQPCVWELFATGDPRGLAPESPGGPLVSLADHARAHGHKDNTHEIEKRMAVMEADELRESLKVSSGQPSRSKSL